LSRPNYSRACRADRGAARSCTRNRGDGQFVSRARVCHTPGAGSVVRAALDRRGGMGRLASWLESPVVGERRGVSDAGRTPPQLQLSLRTRGRVRAVLSSVLSSERPNSEKSCWGFASIPARRIYRLVDRNREALAGTNAGRCGPVCIHSFEVCPWVTTPARARQAYHHLCRLNL
jgi:hypothetical protein